MSAFSDNGSSSHSQSSTGHMTSHGAHHHAVEIVSSSREEALLDNTSVPKPKRLACMICRKRKLKCDGMRPSCSTCARLGHSCAYDEQRRKSGPKRGYVKALEERLKQVETLLKSQDPATTKSAIKSQDTPISSSNNNQPHQSNGAATIPAPNAPMAMKGGDDGWTLNGDSPPQATMDDLKFNTNMNMPMNNSMPPNFTWEMIGLGLEEPLPPQSTIDELHQVYFEKVHPSMPMIHRYRYLAAMSLAPALRPPVCLRYAMWTMACSISEKYSNLKDLFYQRARKYVEADYMKGYGEHMVSVAHCQTHILLAIYEMKMMYFPRAWINTGSAVRLAQMIGLHRMDGEALDVKQCLPPPKDWTEREERRRTFWMAFCEDRYASIGTGWPMTIDERDIKTNLPSSEEAFDMNRPEQTLTLEESTSPSGASRLSSFGGVILMACLFGRNLVHLHRTDGADTDHDLNGPFWKRHRQMDSILLNTSLGFPSRLKLSGGSSNPNIIFTNMSIHTSTICLHQAAIFKAEKNKLPASVSTESKIRCFTAANEIASIMRTISHLDLSSMNPFIAFCLYVSARVFIQYLKSKSNDTQTIDSLSFLLSAMNTLKRRNPLTESFLVQLDIDFEALALRSPELKHIFPRSGESPEEDYIRSGGPVCDDPEGVKGILSFRDECHFVQENDGNAAETLNYSTAQSQNDGAGLKPSHTSGYGGQPYLSAERKAPVLTPNSGSLYEKNAPGSGPMSGFGDIRGESRDASGSPDGGHSAGRTPNSSGSASDHRSQIALGRLGSGAGAGAGTGGPESFHASPISPQQPMMSSHNGVDGSTHREYYQTSNGYTMASDMAGQQAFGMSTGWTGMNGQMPGVQPVGEGLLRALMTMGPMDAMDLSSWDSGNPR